MVKNLPANAGDLGSIPWSGRSPEEGSGNPLQYSCLGNPMDRGAWWAPVHGVARVRQDIATKIIIAMSPSGRNSLGLIQRVHLKLHVSQIIHLSASEVK